MDICGYEFDKKLKIVVKVNSPKTNIVGFDREKNALKVSVQAQPEKGKENAEMINYIKKMKKKKVEIVSGLTSKTKMLKFS